MTTSPFISIPCSVLSWLASCIQRRCSRHTTPPSTRQREVHALRDAIHDKPCPCSSCKTGTLTCNASIALSNCDCLPLYIIRSLLAQDVSYSIARRRTRSCTELSNRAKTHRKCMHARQHAGYTTIKHQLVTNITRVHQKHRYLWFAATTRCPGKAH
jgi:hypothetical protein